MLCRYLPVNECPGQALFSSNLLRKWHINQNPESRLPCLICGVAREAESQRLTTLWPTIVAGVAFCTSASCSSLPAAGRQQKKLSKRKRSSRSDLIASASFKISRQLLESPL